MEPTEQVEQALDKMDIEYQIVHHPAAHTTEEADNYIEGIVGVRTKTMFLTKKTECYLLIMDDAKRLDFHQFQELTGAKRPILSKQLIFYNSQRIWTMNIIF